MLIIVGCGALTPKEPEVKKMDAEEQWCQSQRSKVTAYLAAQKVDHGEVGDWPAWHVDPYVSIWAIESKKSPGWVGWWVIAGDLPTDYVSAEKIKHPRDAMRAIVERWARLAKDMEAGNVGEEVTIGSSEDWPELVPLLNARVKLLKEFASDETIWPD